MSELARINPAVLAAKTEYARLMADASLLPASYKKNPANVLVATEMGEALGLPAITAINEIHVINGKPSASSALISSLVRKAGHRLRVTGDASSATATIIRADDPDFEFKAVWTMDRARQAKLTGKDVWQQYPAAMLKARAITEVARDAAQDALMGVQYTPEELGAAVNEEGNPISVEVGEAVTPAAPKATAEELLAKVDAVATDLDALRELWVEANSAGLEDVKTIITGLVAELKKEAEEAEIEDAEIVEDEQPAADPFAPKVAEGGPETAELFEEVA